MAKVEIVPVEPWHVEAVAADMRPVDVAEVWAIYHVTPEQALQEGMRREGDAWTALFDGVPGAIFGVIPMSVLGNGGQAWLLGTRLLDKHWRIFVRESKAIRDELLLHYDTLTNVAHIENRKTLAWLRWLGASLEVRGNLVRFEICADRQQSLSR